MHVAVDDATRLAYAEELADERGATAAAFLERALAFFAGHGIEVRRLLTDNGTPLPLARLRAPPSDDARPAAPLRTRPYRPQTNGKAEAFVKIAAERLGLQATLRLERRERIAALDRLPALLQWLPTAWRPGRRHAAGQAQVNNLVMQNS